MPPLTRTVIMIAAVSVVAGCSSPAIPTVAPSPKALPANTWPPAWAASVTADERAAIKARAMEAVKAHQSKGGGVLVSTEIFPDSGADWWRTASLVSYRTPPADGSGIPEDLIRFGQFHAKTGEFADNGLTRKAVYDLKIDAYRSTIRNQLELMYDALGAVQDLQMLTRWDPNALGFLAFVQKEGYYLAIAGEFDMTKQLATVRTSEIRRGTYTPLVPPSGL
jgi:hypothetical protein